MYRGKPAYLCGMSTHKLLFVLLCALNLASCKTVSPKTGTTTSKETVQKDIPAREVAEDWVNNDVEEEEPVNAETAEEPVKGTRETRLRFPNFTLLIHDFKGYEAEGEPGNRNFGGMFGGSSEDKEAVLNDEETDQENYKETLIVLKDTLNLSESLVMRGNDNRINNTLFQIIPQNSSDRFRLSMSYLGLVSEIMDHRTHTQEELNRFYEGGQYTAKEQTPYYTLPDSAKFYFRALPHTPDMVEVKVVDGEMVYKTNPEEQLKEEQQQWEKDFARIKEKYKLHDTLVEIPGEYTTVATLTKNRKLYGYGYDAFCFKIERLQGKKTVEKKFVVVYIAYGC